MAQLDMNDIDKRLQKNGWRFIGPILNYESALKNQASVYEKNGRYIVVGLDKTGEKELHDSISKKDAERRTKESIIKISKFMLSSSE